MCCIFVFSVICFNSRVYLTCLKIATKKDTHSNLKVINADWPSFAALDAAALLELGCCCFLAFFAVCKFSRIIILKYWAKLSLGRGRTLFERYSRMMYYRCFVKYSHFQITEF